MRDQLCVAGSAGRMCVARGSRGRRLENRSLLFAFNVHRASRTQETARAFVHRSLARSLAHVAQACTWETAISAGNGVSPSGGPAHVPPTARLLQGSRAQQRRHVSSAVEAQQRGQPRGQQHAPCHPAQSRTASRLPLTGRLRRARQRGPAHPRRPAQTSRPRHLPPGSATAPCAAR